MRHPAETANGRFTYCDYLTWPEGERWEILHGEAFAMTPAPGRLHQKVLGGLVAQFFSQLRESGCDVYPAPFDVRLPVSSEKDEDVDTVVQPDVVVVCDRGKLDDRGCKGAPDLVVEILSPGSVRHDMKRKLSLYEQVGVKEYWVVQPAEKAVMVFSLGENGEYGKPACFTEEDQVPVGWLGPVSIDLQQVFTE